MKYTSSIIILISWGINTCHIYLPLVKQRTISYFGVLHLLGSSSVDGSLTLIVDSEYSLINTDIISPDWRHDMLCMCWVTATTSYKQLACLGILRCSSLPLSHLKIVCIYRRGTLLNQYLDSSPLERHQPEPLNLPSFLRVPARRVQQARPGLGVLELHCLLCCLDRHAALLIHGDELSRLEAGALGDECGSQPGVTSLQCQVEERLFKSCKLVTCQPSELTLTYHGRACATVGSVHTSHPMGLFRARAISSISLQSLFATSAWSLC